MHQHNAPLVCPAAAALGALTRARPVTHVAAGSARMEVASNRRVDRDGAGRIRTMRGSTCVDVAWVALPEGVIDPLLRTVAFYDGVTKVAACHSYATHPMSYYGDGRVSSDFCGLARKRLQREELNCAHRYFTGCAGNIAAGKYNDGTPAARERLLA